MGIAGKRVAFHTLGCKVNQVETQSLRDDFSQRGWQLVSFHEPAEVYIVNSCTVTHVSDRKSRAMLRRAARSHPGALVVLLGCMAATDLKDFDLPEIGLIVNNQDKPRTAELVERWMEARERSGEQEGRHDPALSTNEPIPLPLFRQSHIQRHERSRAFIKIQDGCDSFCSYCIVPYVRGPVRSKAAEDVWAELEQLLLLGYQEIVLTGIHTGHYGLELDDWDLFRLLDLILKRLPENCRLRLSSIEPTEFRPALIRLLTGDPRICRHYHIPLQSGSDRILESMGRPYRRQEYRQLIEGLAQASPGAAFTADVMVGYPGETEADFTDTLQLLQNLPISDLHVFKYSPRSGTPAAAMGDQLAAEIKSERSYRLIELGKRKRQEFIRRQIGEEMAVVLEKKLPDGSWLGLSDNYIEAVLDESPGEAEPASGSLQRARLTAWSDGQARGVLWS